MNNTILSVSRSTFLLILVSALGYFVDVYDLLLFSVVRQKSLLDLGVAAADSLSVGLRLLNIQMAGMLIGGFAWGVLGEKKGRLSVLFGSIILYSLANLLNAYVQTIPQYEVLRFIAGLGLAGELVCGDHIGIRNDEPAETRFRHDVCHGYRLSGCGGGRICQRVCRMADRFFNRRRHRAGAAWHAVWIV